MKLYELTNDIFDMADDNEVMIGTGMEYVLNNIQDAFKEDDMYVYTGGNLKLEDYKALHPYLDELLASKNDYSKFVRKNYEKIVALRKEDKFDEVIELGRDFMGK